MFSGIGGFHKAFLKLEKVIFDTKPEHNENKIHENAEEISKIKNGGNK